MVSYQVQNAAERNESFGVGWIYLNRLTKPFQCALGLLLAGIQQRQRVKRLRELGVFLQSFLEMLPGLIGMLFAQGAHSGIQFGFGLCGYLEGWDRNPVLGSSLTCPDCGAH